MRTSLAVAALLVLASLAGCLGARTGSSGADDGDADEPAPNLTDVRAALEAGEDGANVEKLAEPSLSSTQEIDPAAGRLFVDQGSTVEILDSSDPANLTRLGNVSFPSVVDVKASDDGDWIFTGSDQSASSPPLGGNGPLTGGFYVTDVSDPSSPEQTDVLPVGPQRGPHMVYHQRYPDDREIVFGAAGPDVVVTAFDRSEGTLEEVARYTPGQMAQERDPDRVGPLYNPQGWVHDMFVQVEPDGRVLMYVAAWDAGLRVVDVTDPSEPEELGHWSEFGEDEAGNLHTVSTEWIGDRRITVGAVEVGFGVVGGAAYARGDERPVTYVWDTTDPSNVQLLGRWINPVKETAGRDLVPDEEIDSTHNLQLENGRIYQAHYDLGVWVIDVSTPANMTEPATVGFFDDGRMSTWDVVLVDGAMITSGAVGVQPLHFALDQLGPDGTTSRA